MATLAIIVPGIRPHFWQRLFESAKLSCQKYDFKMVFSGPFDPPKELAREADVWYLKSYDTVPVCLQTASIACRSSFIFHTVDDGVLLENAIDHCLDHLLLVGPDDNVMNMRYREGGGFSGSAWPEAAWKAGYHADLRLPGIDPNWDICLQPLMKQTLFEEFGGLDCRFRYSNHSHHDILFRMQKSNIKVIHSPVEVSSADHMPGESGDHREIHRAQTINDQPIFEEMYKNGDRPSKVEFSNWVQYRGDWKDRFPKRYETYEEMVAGQGYQV